MTEILGINSLNLIIWFGFGLLAGALLHAIDPGDVKGGVMGTIILGILGAVIGGILSNMIFGTDLLSISMRGLTTAIIGGLIMAALFRLFFRDKRKIKT